MNEKITKLRENPPVNDIPGWLRKIAEDWEKGEFGARDFCLVVIPAKDDHHWPMVHMIGNNPGQTMVNGVISEAQAFMTIHKVARVR